MTIVSLLASSPAPASPEPAALGRALWDAWPEARVYAGDPWGLKHAELRAQLARLSRAHPGFLRTLEEGKSAEGREIPLLSIGDGPTAVLLWSQMHGDEPTATVALLDVLNHLGRSRAEPATKGILSKLTLLVIPMLNPDGAERTQRRNAQELDVNRDALALATPEGRFLKSVRDTYRPSVGYNLHNQGPLTQAGTGGKQAALSLLAVPWDEKVTEDERLRLTKRLAVRVADLVSPHAAGRVSRYDMDYTERAFGDSMTRWGTPTLLIESGGWHGEGESDRLVRLDFVAILGTLRALADDSLASVDPGRYDELPLNARERLHHLVLRGGLVAQPGLPTFAADVAFDRPTSFAGDRPRRREAILVESGDLSTFAGCEEWDATGRLLVPWPTDALSWDALVAEVSRDGVSGLREGETVTEASLGRFLKTQPGSWRARLAYGFAGAVLVYRRRSADSDSLVLERAVLRGVLVGPKAAPSGTK